MRLIKMTFFPMFNPGTRF